MAKEGLITGINYIREQFASEQYKSKIPIIEDTDDISVLSKPVLEFPEVYNEFLHSLISRIAYTRFENKLFNNPLQVLEGDNLPLGYVGQEIFTNPAQGRKFDNSDFAGLLKKYEADVKVQYLPLNMDLQYPVTVSRQQLRTAFISWGNLESMIDNLVNSLYNGAYINRYKFTKAIVSSAYMNNRAVIQQVNAPVDKQSSNQFIKTLTNAFLDFSSPSSKFNAWQKCGGEGRPITTFTEPSEIITILSNKVSTDVTIESLASAYQLDKIDLKGNVIRVDNFDVYNDKGVKIFDGSKIQGIICDKSFFKIKTQDMYLDTPFRNINNRTEQWILNDIRMYQFSLFANAIILATELPA